MALGERAGQLVAWAQRRRDLVGLGLAYLLWRIVALTLLGQGLNLWPLRLGFDMHLLPLDQLRAQPVSSLWYLHAQPPAYNAVTALLVHLPRASWPVLVWTGSVLLGLAASTMAYQAALDLGVRRWLAMAGIGLGFALNPGVLMASDYYLYSYWAACMASASLLCLVRWLTLRRSAWGLGFLGLAAGLVLSDSLYQWPWFVGAALLALVGTKLPGRQLVLVAALPVLLVAALTAKDVLQFHQPSSSSWSGINLSRRVFAPMPKAQLQELLRRGELSALATTPGFRGLGVPDARGRYYVNPALGYATKVPVSRTGHPVLDLTYKANGRPNFNNEAYRTVSSRLMAQDLAAITAAPGTYLKGTGPTLRIWSMPSSENFFFWGPPSFSDNPRFAAYNAWSKAGGLHTPAFDAYAKAYNRVLGLSLHGAKRGSWIGLDGAVVEPRLSQVSWSAVLVTLACLLGLPLLAWLRRSDRRQLAAYLYLWGTVAWVFALSCFVEVGENDRFRASLGALPILGALLVLQATVDWLQRRRGASA